LKHLSGNPCHQGMERHQGAEGHQIWRVAANILNR